MVKQEGLALPHFIGKKAEAYGSDVTGQNHTASQIDSQIYLLPKPGASPPNPGQR